MSDAVWKQVDVAGLGADAVKLWEAKRKADAAAKVEREAFETHVRGLVAANVPQGKRLAMGYRFGKFSVALVEDDKPAAKAAAKPLTLTQALGL